VEVYNPEMNRLGIITDNLVKIALQQIVKMAASASLVSNGSEGGG
jgi:hypothetical protein